MIANLNEIRGLKPTISMIRLLKAFKPICDRNLTKLEQNLLCNLYSKELIDNEKKLVQNGIMSKNEQMINT